MHSKIRHRFATALEWFARGETVQVKTGVNSWTTVSLDGLVRHAECGENRTFRIEPEPIKLGNVVVNSPEFHPVNLQTYYYWNISISTTDSIVFENDNGRHIRMRDRGMLFNSHSDCCNVFDALKEILCVKQQVTEI